MATHFEFTSRKEIEDLFNGREQAANELAASMAAPVAKRGRGRPRKNPDAPAKSSRRPNNYNLFMSEKLKTIHIEMPGLSRSECMRLAAQTWNKADT